MTNKTKHYKLLTMSAILLITSAVYSKDEIESARVNASQFDTGGAKDAINMDIKELINGQTQEIKEPLPQAESETGSSIMPRHMERVMLALYVPVSQNPIKDIELRTGRLEQKYGFLWDKSYEPVLMAESREQSGPIWTGMRIYRIRGWVSKSGLAGLRNDIMVKAVSVWTDLPVSEISAGKIVDVTVELFVPVAPFDSHDDLKGRIARLERNYPFYHDRSSQPLLKMAPNEPIPLSGTRIYLVRGWIAESCIKDLEADRMVGKVLSNHAK